MPARGTHQSADPSQTQPQSAEQAIAAKTRLSRTRPFLSTILLLFALYFSAVLLLQALSGAYSAELSGFADEPSHFITGLMVRDYIADGFGRAPLQFAENYYLHYPKVALGHWPPLFYLIEAFWWLMFSVSKNSLLVLMAIFTALCATVFALWLRRCYEWPAALLTAFLFITLPLVQRLTNSIMLEMPLTLWSLLAGIQFANLMKSRSWRSSILFGLFASLALLTKGNAWALALLPAITIVLTRRYSLLQAPQFWLPAAVIGVVCGPWQVLTFHMVSSGWVLTPGFAYILPAFGSLVQASLTSTGPVIFLISLTGGIVAVAIPLLKRRALDADMSVMLALFLSVYLFHAFVPVGVEERYMAAGIPGLLAFLPAGISAICAFLGKQRFEWLNRPAVMASTAGLFFAAGTFEIVHKDSYGFSQAASWLAGQSDLEQGAVLVSSPAGGEGVMIAEMALREHRPGHFLLRATKFLANADWKGGDYRLQFDRIEDVQAELNRIPVRLLVVDFTPSHPVPPDFRQVLSLVSGQTGEWHLAGSFGVNNSDVRGVRIFRHDGDLKVRGKIQVDLTRTLKRVLEE